MGGNAFANTQRLDEDTYASLCARIREYPLNCNKKWLKHSCLTEL